MTKSGIEEERNASKARPSRLALPIFFLSLGLYLLTTRGLTWGDDLVHLDVALGISERGSVALSFNPGKFFSDRNEQGQIQSALWPGYPLIATPLVALTSWIKGCFSSERVGSLSGLLQAMFPDSPELFIHPNYEPEGLRDEEQLARYRGLGPSDLLRLLNSDLRVQAFDLVNPIASAGTVAVFFLCCLALGLSLRIGIWSAVALAVASPVFSYAGSCWTQPLAMFFLALASLFAVRSSSSPGRREILLSAVFLSLMVCVRPDFVLVASIAVIGVGWLAWQRNGMRSAAISTGMMLLPLFVGAFLLVLWNWLRFSHLWVLPGDNQLMLFRARYMPEGMLGLVFSPGVGLLFYFPFVAFAIRGLLASRSRPRVFLWIALLQTMSAIVLYSAWWQWHSTEAQGPRYLLPVVPVIAVAAAYGLRDAGKWLWRTMKVLIVFGFFVQLPAVLLISHKLPEVTDPSVWASFRSFSAWSSVIRSIGFRESIEGYPPGLDWLSTGSWFLSVSGLAALLLGSVLLWVRRDVDGQVGTIEAKSAAEAGADGASAGVEGS